MGLRGDWRRKISIAAGELKEVIIRAGKLTQEYHQKIFKAEEKYLREELERKGMIIQTVDKVAFQTKASRAVKESLPEELIEIYEEIEKLN